MSLHKSLKQRASLVRKRNVLTRAERVARLVQEERWTEGRSVFGLPKVKVRQAVPRARREEKPKEAAAEGAPAAEAAAQASAPAQEQPAKGKDKGKKA